jgi:hypothetical protein
VRVRVRVMVWTISWILPVLFHGCFNVEYGTTGEIFRARVGVEIRVRVK